MADTTLDQRFWVCACDDFHVHSKVNEHPENCPECGVLAEDAPDSMVFEIEKGYSSFKVCLCATELIRSEPFNLSSAYSMAD